MGPTPINKKTDPLITAKNLTEQSADIYIYGVIVDNSDFKWDESDVMPDDVINALEQVEGVKELNIYVNSPGGSVFSGLAIYNILKRNEAKKTVYVDGLAASMASVIALVGDKVIIPSNAFLMIHKPMTIAIGNSTEFKKVAEDLDNIESGLMNVYKENMKEGVGLETIQQMVDDETWLNGDEAARYFNVEVVESKNIAACASDYLKNFDKTPQKLMAGQGKPSNKPKPNETNEPPVNENEPQDEEQLKFQNELDLLNL